MPNTSQTRSTDELARLVALRLRCLQQLRDLGQRQLDLIEADAMPELMGLLATKGRIIDALAHLETQLDPHRGDDPQQRSWPNEGQRQTCARQVAACEALVREIQQQEQHSSQALVRRRDAALQQLQGAHFAGQARGAYAAQPVCSADQLDLREDGA